MRRRALAAALLCCALGWSWQWLTVHYNYGGKWTSLFCQGAQIPLPAALAGEPFTTTPSPGRGFLGPMLLFLALRGGWVNAIPMILVAPRVWLELGAQAWGIARGVAG
ncbi:MAG: hypothetical protein ABI806_16550 [Candidatus Solibacter sp.]